MKEFEQDKDFQEVHEKYQAMAKELPPPSLDASILQAAHLAVENSTVDKHDVDEHTHIQSGIDTQSVKRAWYVPVSYVAMLVISLSVVMRLALDPEMSPMMDENQPFDMPEADSMLMEQEVSAPLATMAESPPAKRKRAKSAPAREKSEELRSESISQQRLNERKQKIQEQPISRAKISKNNVFKDKAFKEQILSEETYIEKKRAKADSGQMLSSSQMEDNKAEPAALAPVASSVEPSAEISVGANSSSNYMSGIKAEKRLSDEFSSVNTVKNNKQKEITLKQQSEVKKLIDLYEKKQYKELKLALQSYRKDYPASEKTEALPEVLLDWEKENISPPPTK